MSKYDFSGWATRNNIRCSDGRIIAKDAFKECNGKTVPLVWNHDHSNPENVIGHALLKNMDDGVYAYCTLNDTPRGVISKKIVDNGDVCALSIYANKLKQNGPEVVHGAIREVSLVLAGANPGALIDDVMEHDDSDGDCAIIYTGYEYISHGDDDSETVEAPVTQTATEEPVIEHAEGDSKTESKDRTIDDVVNTMNEEQQRVFFGVLGAVALANEEGDDTEEEGTSEMKQNVFEMDTKNDDKVLMHDAMDTIIKDAKRCGSMKESYLQHAEEYGIQNIDWLFPEPNLQNNPPEFIKRDDSWVSTVMTGVHRSPFSRIKSQFADLREDEARAKGYMKGKLKKDEVFSLLKRTTGPTTVYKKQKMDRDDKIDITDFDVVAWLKAEMRMMLDEEIARAILIGDGRLASSDDKIDEQCIRPIWKDEELFTIHATVDGTTNNTADARAKEFIRTVIKSRKDYKGSGNPVLFTTEDFLTDCLLLTDEIGRDLYDSVEKLATKLRVSRIVTVEVMENQTRQQDSSKFELMGLIVNLNDYNVGADRGGAINMFEDFDIDYNQEKYLIETRCSGALVKPYSAIAVELKTA